MDYLKRFFRLRQEKPSNIEQRVSWLLLPYMGYVEDILLWTNPVVSFWCLIAVNVLLWLITLLEWRVLGLFAGFVLCCVTLDGTATALGAGKRPRCGRSSQDTNAGRLKESYDFIACYAVRAFRQMKAFRESEPKKFCGWTCIALSSFIILVKFLGALMDHMVVTGLFLMPLTPNLLTKLHAMHSNHDSDHEVEEFMPELTTTVIEELNRADEAQEEKENYTSLTADIPLPPSAKAALLYAAGEADSAESSDDDYIESNVQGKGTPPSATESVDSESDFFPDGLDIADGSMPTEVTIPERIVDSVMTLLGRNTSETDDDFEIIDKSELYDAK